MIIQVKIWTFKTTNIFNVSFSYFDRIYILVHVSNLYDVTNM